MNILKLLNRSVSNKNVVFKNHPFDKGYAVLAEPSQIGRVKPFGFGASINSQDFETLQRRAAKENVNVVWMN